MSTTESAIVVHVDFAPGNLANKMLQYLAAASISERLPGSVISNVNIEEWGIDIAPVIQSNPKTLRISSTVTKALDFNEIVEAVKNDAVNRIELNIYSSHLHNMPTLDFCRGAFPLAPDAHGFGHEILLINIRGDEILKAIHPEYTVLPPEFYADVISDTGLTPVFFGQVDGDSHYIKRLKDFFPNARFVGSRGAIHDFSVIARSKNIVSAISTFSWLAAWLSTADRVVMPLSGFCNPLQYPAVDFVPKEDSRFFFWLFPFNKAAPDEEIEQTHKRLLGRWIKVIPGDLTQVLWNEMNGSSRSSTDGRVSR